MESMIYFIQEQDPPHRIKIGYSLNPEKRIATISATNASKMQVLKIIEGEREDERWLHYYLREYRVNGKREWYYPDSDLLDFIDSKIDPKIGGRWVSYD